MSDNSLLISREATNFELWLATANMLDDNSTFEHWQDELLGNMSHDLPGEGQRASISLAMSAIVGSKAIISIRKLE